MATQFRSPPDPVVLVREYGCTICQRHHRRGIDAEYEPHLLHQSRHGWRDRPATAAERFALAVGPLEFGGAP